MSICEYDDKEEIRALMRRYYGRMGWRKGLEERAILKGMLMERVRNIIKKLQKSYSPAQTADFFEQDEEFVQSIYQIAEQMEPDYNIRKFVEIFQEKNVIYS